MNRYHYSNMAVDLKRYFCKRYNHYKRKSHSYLNCGMCPACNSETGDCYMLMIIREMTQRRKQNEHRVNS